MIGVAFFGGPFVWIMIFVTHLVFRRPRRAGEQRSLRFAPAGPWSSLFGLAALMAVLVSTWWVPGFRITMVAGLPWLRSSRCATLSWAGATGAKAGRKMRIYGEQNG